MTATAAWNEEGRRLFDAGNIEAARSLFLRAASDPQALGASINVAQCDFRLGDIAAAERRVREVLETRVDFVPALRLLSAVLTQSGRLPEALEAMRRAVECAPGDARVHSHLGDLQAQLGEYEQAAASYDCAVRHDPADSASLAALVGLKRSLCDWNGLDVLSQRLRHSVIEGIGAAPPFDFLREHASAQEQRACASAWVARRFPRRSAPPPGRARSGPPRIGFISHGFWAQATAALVVALVEALARRGAPLQLFSTSPDDGSGIRRRLASAVPVHDLSALSPSSMEAVVRQAGIDVMFDLDGPKSERTQALLSRRPASIQVSWLGFPGTTGAPYLDYVVADRFVLPPSLASFFTEAIAWLPRCFQPNDTRRTIGMPLPREDYGLPAQAVVFVCFNAVQKLNPSSFYRMLHVLREVPDAVLWLLEGKGNAPERLRREASGQGIDPGRLVFFPFRGNHAYLAAYRHADLFLDTDDFNAHTTASDAMWAGCPVLTLPGTTFASRVAGSLNHHAGLHELNADDEASFVARAVRVGLDGGYRASLKARLAQARSSSPLFDMDGFALDFLRLAAGLRRPRLLP